MRLQLTSIALIAVLSACGGGGGGSVPSDTLRPGADHKQSRSTVPLLDAVVLEFIYSPYTYQSGQPDTSTPGGEHESVSPTHPLQGAQVSDATLFGQTPLLRQNHF